MKLYIAGSFRNAAKIRIFAQRLREEGLGCYVFCDRDETTNTLSEELRDTYDLAILKPNTALRLDIVRQIGELNAAALKKCDAAIVVLPSGKSAHLEAGYMIGRGKPVWVYGPMPRGDFDAMYVMTKGLYDEHEYQELVKDIFAYNAELNRGEVNGS